jgi:hypothetical protein
VYLLVRTGFIFETQISVLLNISKEHTDYQVILKYYHCPANRKTGKKEAVQKSFYPCHSERSEESIFLIMRCFSIVQHDKKVPIKTFWTPS